MGSLLVAVVVALSIDLGGGVTIELVDVSPGSFQQGSPANEEGRSDDEVQRQVTITKPFDISAGLITREAFERFVNETGYRTEAERGTSGGYGVENGALVQSPKYTWRTPGFAQAPKDPVVLVTYDDAEAFTAWASKVTDRRVRLPTEAEWEYAARVRPGRLHDLLGTYQQWCADWYAPWTADDVFDPRNNGTEKRRVLRGGSFLKSARNARIAARSQQTPGSRNADNSFRVVVEPGFGTRGLGTVASTSFKTAGDDLLRWWWVPIIGAVIWAVFRPTKKKTASASAIRTEIMADRIVIRNVKAGERLRVTYRDPSGQAVARELDAADVVTVLFTGELVKDVMVERVNAATSSPRRAESRRRESESSSTWDPPSAY